MNRKRDSEIRRISFPTELARQVARICARRKCTFSAFVQEAVVNALQEKRQRNA